MKVKGTRTVKVEDIQTNLFVRKALNWDHAFFLGELIANGVEMNLIEVTDIGKDTNIAVDGRHRKEGYSFNGISEVQVKILEFEDETEMIAYAYKANTGGSLPPTQQDTEHTVMLLLEHGVAKKYIGELLGLPSGMGRKYVDNVQSRMARAKLQRAAAAVTEGGLTVAKAAEQYGVELAKLKDLLSGNKRSKHRGGLIEIHRTITATHKSLSLKDANAIKGLLEKYEDGDVTEKHVRELFSHIGKLHKKAAHGLADWEKRFEAIAMNGKIAETS